MNQKSYVPLQDVGARIPDLGKYALVEGGAGAATLTGFYLDQDGNQISRAVSYTINGTPTTFLALASAAGYPILNNAVGFYATNLTEPIYVNLGGQVDGSVGFVPDANSIVIAAGQGIGFGRAGIGIELPPNVVSVSGSLSTGTLTVEPVASQPTDRSGTILAGGTAQQLMPANSGRKGWRFLNLSNADLWINAQGVAAVIAGLGSFKYPTGSGEGVGSCTTSASISIIGATLGQAFSAEEY